MSDKPHIVKVVFKFERELWRVTVLQKPPGAKEPVLAFRAKHAAFGDAWGGVETWMREKGLVLT